MDKAKPQNPPEFCSLGSIAEMRRVYIDLVNAHERLTGLDGSRNTILALDLVAGHINNLAEILRQEVCRFSELPRDPRVIVRNLSNEEYVRLCEKRDLVPAPIQP